MPLGERLALFTAAVEKHGQPFAVAYQNLISQLKGAEAGGVTPGIGDALPRFLLPDDTGRLVDLETLTAQGPVVVSFNRGHWCEYCELELRAFASAHAEIAACGAQVVSIMPERAEYTRKVRALTDETVTVLSDIDNGYALSVGVVMWLGDDGSRPLQAVRTRYRALSGQWDVVRAHTGDVRAGPAGTHRRAQG